MNHPRSPQNVRRMVTAGPAVALASPRTLTAVSPPESTIMARRIVVMVVVLVVFRLATNNRPDRVGIAVLVEPFAWHELARRARLETFVKLPQLVRQPVTERLRHLDLASGGVGITDRLQSPAQVVDQHD